MQTLFLRRLLLSVLLFTLLVPSSELSAWAQDKGKDKQAPQAPQPQTAPGYSISVTVPVVSVDVVVTDNNGNYLRDLKKENFRISEDGAVQTITNFRALRSPDHDRPAPGIQQSSAINFLPPTRAVGPWPS